MITKFVEVTNGFNWGKFLILRFDEEWSVPSELPQEAATMSLLGSQGWAPEHLWVLDLATGEGACFRPGGSPHYDLERHRVWVCPMFEPFLAWLYRQDLTDLARLPGVVTFSEQEAPSAFRGYRRGSQSSPP